MNIETVVGIDPETITANVLAKAVMRHEESIEQLKAEHQQLVADKIRVEETLHTMTQALERLKRDTKLLVGGNNE
jgi:hypothetical protein